MIFDRAVLVGDEGLRKIVIDLSDNRNIIRLDLLMLVTAVVYPPISENNPAIYSIFLA
jgi:hypothetical protein